MSVATLWCSSRDQLWFYSIPNQIKFPVTVNVQLFHFPSQRTNALKALCLSNQTRKWSPCLPPDSQSLKPMGLATQGIRQSSCSYELTSFAFSGVLCQMHDIVHLLSFRSALEKTIMSLFLNMGKLFSWLHLPDFSEAGGTVSSSALSLLQGDPLMPLKANRRPRRLWSLAGPLERRSWTWDKVLPGAFLVFSLPAPNPSL